MNNVYLETLLEREELQFYIRNFGGGILKKNPMFERIKHLPKKELLKEYNLIQEKKSNLSKRERDLVIYFIEKL